MLSLQSDAAWDAALAMLADLTEVVREDARDDRERVEGYRVLARTLALCSELSFDVDPDVPRFFAMTTALRQVGGPNPDGEYDLCAIIPGRAYRVSGRRGSVTYVGFQVMAGVGLSPRRQAAYLSDTELEIEGDGRFSFVLAPDDPGTGEHWLPVPEDASAIVVRQYVADRSSETLATYEIEQVEPAEPLTAYDDGAAAAQVTAFTWTMFKLMTLHRTVLPDLPQRPNRLVTAEAAALGSENTTPDNLYMLGCFDLADDESLVLDIEPPRTRYWSVNLESIWHECLDPSRTRSSGTNATFEPRPDGSVRVVVGAQRPPAPNWLDTGGRSRGFVTLRWLDNPQAPPVTVEVVPTRSVNP